MEARETIKNIEVALDLLEYISHNPDGIGVREASRLTEVPKSTVQRIFNSLLAKGMVALNPLTEQYVLDAGILRIATRYQEQNNLLVVSDEILSKLRDEVNETVCLHVLVNDQLLPILQHKSHKELSWLLTVGKFYPLNSGATGRVCMAYMPEEKLRQLIPSFRKITPKTIMDPEQIIETARSVRNQSYAISHGEISEGAIGTAAPILDRKGELIAVIGLYGPEFRIQPNLDNYLQKLLAAKEEIQQKLF
jgi:DNA-binding IclR family transcriptional regulator